MRYKSRMDYIRTLNNIKNIKSKTEEVISVLSMSDWRYKSFYIYTLMTSLATAKMLMVELRKHIDEFDRRNIMNDAAIDILIQRNTKEILDNSKLISSMIDKEAEESF